MTSWEAAERFEVDAVRAQAEDEERAMQEAVDSVAAAIRAAYARLVEAGHGTMVEGEFEAFTGAILRFDIVKRHW